MVTGLAGATGACVGNWTPEGIAAERLVQIPDEDGYKLWLRYTPPGAVARSYRRIVRQIRVEGTSATSGIIRDELRSATASILGSGLPLDDKGCRTAHSLSARQQTQR